MESTNEAPTYNSPIPSWHYATFLERAAAVIIDSFIVSIATIALGILLHSSKDSTIQGNIFRLAPFLYNILLLSRDGTTIGKKIMHLTVVSEDQKKLTIGQIILRETLGKILSSLILCIGYIVMISDPRKQTWHDKIAKTLVIKHTSVN